MAKNEKFIHKVLKYLGTVVLVFIFFEILFFFFAKPILKSTLENWVYKKSDSVYTLDFDKLRINMLNGNILLTNFEITPDTLGYFSKNNSITKNLYEIQLDTFQIKQIRLFPLIRKNNELSIKLLKLSNPQVKIFARNKNKNRIDTIPDNSSSYETVRKDLLESVFKYTNAFQVNKIIITDGNFDFLKPRSDNQNPFSIGKITLILNNFFADINTFSFEENSLFSEDIEIIVADYELKLNDNIHVLDAKRVYINTFEKHIQLDNIQLHPLNNDFLSHINEEVNIFDISIDEMSFNNSDFKEIYEDQILHLTKAQIDNLSIKIFKQKINEKKKFNKDTLFDKIDVFPLFSNYLSFVQIDTIGVTSGNFANYEKVTSNIAQTSIRNFKVDVFNFLIDSTSVTDTSRLLYAKDMIMTFDGFKFIMKDSIHQLTAEHIEASTEQSGVTARNIEITPKVGRLGWAISNHKSYNDINIKQLDISGFDFVKFSNNNELIVNQFKINDADFSLKSFPDTIKKTKTQPIDQLLQSFADKIVIKEIDIPNGYLNFATTKKHKTTKFSGNFQISLHRFIFNPYKEKLTKYASVGSANLLFFNINFYTADSLYKFSTDTIRYSTYQQKIILANLRFKPIENKIQKKLRQSNKSTIVDIVIPRIIISNTNLSNALQADSLSLKTVTLANPIFEISSFPNIAQKHTKKIYITLYKKKVIRNIVQTSADVEVYAYIGVSNRDSAALETFRYKKKSIDTLTKYSVHVITQLKINPKDIRANDTSIAIISQIEDFTVDRIEKLANSNLTKNQIDSITFSTLSEIYHIDELYKAPNFDKDEIFNTIGQFLPKINSDSLYVKNGQVIFKSRTKDSKRVVFKTKFDLKLCKFDFNVDSISSNEKILFSDKFMININNSIFNLKDSIHQAKVSKIRFSSFDSVISAHNIMIVPKYRDSSQISMFVKIDNIKTDGVDFQKLYIEHLLDVSDITISEPIVKLHLSSTNKKQKSKKAIRILFYLPPQIDELFVEKICLKDCQIKLKRDFQDTTIEFFKSNLNVNFYEFKIDSVTNILENIFIAPIDNFDLTLTDFSFITPDTMQRIMADSVYVNSKNGNIIISNPKISTTILDSNVLVDYAKDKQVFNFSSKNLNIFGLDLYKLRFDNQLVFNSMFIDTPRIELYKPAKEKSVTKKQFKPEDVDLYATTKKFFAKINVNSIRLTDIALMMKTCSDTLITEQYFEKIDLTLSGLLIDSTTSATTPNLFYCDDINFSVRDYEMLTKDKIYRGAVGEINLSTKMKTISVNNFEFKPTIPTYSVQDSFKYKTTIFDVEGKNIIIKGIEFLELFNKKINAREIDGNSIILKTYADKNYEQSPWEKKHLISHILDAPIEMNIGSATISDLDIYYEEINPENQQKAYINLNDCTVKIIRITNDTARINKDGVTTIIKSNGMINDSAELVLNLFYDLKYRGNNAKVSGEIGACNANLFNTYTVNGVNLDLAEGVFHGINFDFKIKDTLAIGKMKIEYNDLKAYLISKDTLKRNPLKFVSWIANVILVKNNNPKYGIYPKQGKIAYIHDKKFGDIGLLVKALLSGVQSTIAFDPKDAKKIRKIMRNNKDKVKDEKEKKANLLFD